jgi:hypothetical protein
MVRDEHCVKSQLLLYSFELYRVHCVRWPDTDTNVTSSSLLAEPAIEAVL